MTYEEIKRHCCARGSIYRKSKEVKHIKHHTQPLDERVSEEDKLADDWEEYDPRDDDDCSLFMFND